MIANPLIQARQKEKVNVLKYSFREGFTSYNIRKIIQDNYGFIWVAMQDGLCRFDGHNFIYYRRSAPAKRRLLGVDIRDLAYDSSTNTIWALSGEGGLNAINCATGAVTAAVPVQSENDEDWSICMTLSGNKLWIGAFSRIKIYNIERQRFEPAPSLPASGIPHAMQIRNIHADPYGNIWAGITGYGIAILSGKDNRLLRTIPLTTTGDGLPALRILSAVHPKPGHALLGTSRGLREVVYDRHYASGIDQQPSKGAAILNQAEITALNLNREGRLMAATDQQLYRLAADLSAAAILEEPEKKYTSNWFSAVQCIYTDRQNNLWLGCAQGLAFISQQPSPLLPVYRSANGIDKLEHVYSLCALPNGDVLAGLHDGLVLADIRSNSFRRIDNHACYHIFKDPYDRILAATKQGLFIYHDGRLSPAGGVYKELQPYSSYSLISYLQLTDSTAVLGTDNFHGILVWNFRRKTITPVSMSSPQAKLAADVVNTLYKDKQQRLWVLADKAITVFDERLQHSEFISFQDSITRQPYNIFFDITESHGYYWVAAYGMGLIQIDPQFRVKHIYSEQQGLCNDGVYKLFNYRDSILVITSNNGLSLFDLNRHTFNNYFEKDGLHANTFEEACGAYQYGRIYTGGINGFTIIDPGKLHMNNTPPRLYLQSVRIETATGETDTANIHLSALTVPSNVLQSTIYFSALNYLSPGRTTYAYKIDELHNDWISLGAQHYLTLTGLAPGTYTLRVKAANEDGIWTDGLLSLKLSYQPKWYQTLWFRFLLAAAIAACLYSLYLYRISQLRKQQQIRREIAGDLHDDLGATLNSIKVFAHLAHKEPQQEKHHFQIAELLVQATTSLRDMIWVLDESADTVHELAERIKKFALPVANAKGINFECRIAGEVHACILTKTEKRNLLLIAKESINNSIKYAACKNIRITFEQVDKKAALFISDDGKGFDSSVQYTGSGLKNIRYRARQIHYEADISSGPGNTSVKIARRLTQASRT